MTVVKCDFCGAEIVVRHHDIDKCSNHQDKGWAVLEGVKFTTRWEKDVCPKCLPVGPA